jgi:DNA-binding transcriptional ArsR family regulator
MDVSSAEHFKALGHPTRQRLLFELDRPATISQLAVTLDTHKGNIAHHLKVLRAAGLVSITSTRQVRGGTEQYYQRVAQIMRVSGAQATATLPATFDAIAAEISAAAPDPFLALRHLRLTADQVERVTVTLNELLHHTEEAAEGQPRYGMLLGLYQQLDASAQQLDTRA